MENTNKEKDYGHMENTEDGMVRIPAVALRGMTVLPGLVIHFDLNRGKSILAVEKAMMSGQRLFLVTQRDVEDEEPDFEGVYHMGCLAQIRQVTRLPENVVRVLVEGQQRGRLTGFAEEGAFLLGEIEPVEAPSHLADSREEDAAGAGVEIEEEAMTRSLKELFLEFASYFPRIGQSVKRRIDSGISLGRLMDEMIESMPVDYEKKQAVLEAVDLDTRYQVLAGILYEEIGVARIRAELAEQVKARMDKNQRDYMLREQMNYIRQELGEDTISSDAEQFQTELDRLKASREVKDKIRREISRFKSLGQGSAEASVERGYLETLLELPWDKASKDNQDINYAKQVLEEDHYGLEQVKERILEFLAVRTLTQKGESPILCLAGPPGTGKTSIAKSLARALKKPYVRISLGGVRDEAEIRGHRKTYVGAMPGRIANGIRTAGVKNPVMLLDEIDKVSTDYKGDTFSALLEVLDSEQNSRFRDHYLEVPLDLSEVMFITTANTLQTIPRPLLDRMEVIEITSYTENEKLHIAAEHLIPKQLEKHGLTASQLTFSRQAVWKMARNYTKEAGVRQLEREIGNVCRKAAKEILTTGREKIAVTDRNIHRFLGKEKYTYQMANPAPEIGIVRGLAWTSVGGDTLQIEVNVMPGSGELMLTGQLGDVMKESAQTGISYIRSVSGRYGIEEDFFEKHDIHVHIPEGAVPKDGPSAGITMATAMLSAVTGKRVRADLAMTGEITLHGDVLPIGGLREKTMAATTPEAAPGLSS